MDRRAPLRGGGRVVGRVAGGSWQGVAALVTFLAVTSTSKGWRDQLVRCPFCRKRHDLGATVCPY